MSRVLLTKDPRNLRGSVLGNLPFMVETKKGPRVITTVPDAHEAAYCREGSNCTGPGCNIRTNR